jgi:uncharacterized protein
MNRIETIVCFCFFLCISLTALGQKPQHDYPIQPVIFTNVKLTDEFWAKRIKTNHEVTIPFTLGKCKSTGRIKNFEIAGGLAHGDFCGEFTFDDTDVYKIIEGASYSMQIFNDPALDARVDSLIFLIGKAQEPDGYIYTNRTIMGDRAHEWAGKKRWEKESDLSHELYNIGHLIEAGIAHHYATRKNSLLDIAVKAADRVCADFAPDKLHIWPGHQIIELALAKLYRVTGDKKYLETAKFLLDIRDNGSEYSQSQKKVIDQHEAVGHAVRATYMYAGMADVAALTEDKNYLKAIDDIWNDVVSRKLYVTGGIGATGNGEAFGAPYDLPNMSAYNETCASIANVYWNYRLFLLHGDAKYFDVLERTLYNAFLSGVSLSGDRFFYPNPLESQGQHSRSAWFSCACCPGNVTRFVPSVGGYFYAKKENSIYVNLFANSEASFTLGEKKVSLAQSTAYPVDGKIDINVTPENSFEFEVRVRIPGWALGKPMPSDLYTYVDQSKAPVVKLNGKTVKLQLDQGYLVLKRKWKKGDVISLDLPMDIKRIKAHDKVVADAGKLSYERGPLVYCAEWPDNPDNKVLNLVVEKSSPLETATASILGGVTLIKSDGKSVSRDGGNSVKSNPAKVTLIPYYAWAHRGAGEMMVWIPERAESSRPLPAPTIASQSKISASRNGATLMSLNDQMVPANSNDQTILFYHWWPLKDTTQYVQYDFNKSQSVSSSSVYWFDDSPFGDCRIPSGWKLLYRKQDQWIPVVNKTPYAVNKDAWSEVNFEAVETDALRLEITLPKEHSAGMFEWSVK